eukprot:g35195.t1
MMEGVINSAIKQHYLMDVQLPYQGIQALGQMVENGLRIIRCRKEGWLHDGLGCIHNSVLGRAVAVPSCIGCYIGNVPILWHFSRMKGFLSLLSLHFCWACPAGDGDDGVWDIVCEDISEPDKFLLTGGRGLMAIIRFLII